MLAEGFALRTGAGCSNFVADCYVSAMPSFFKSDVRTLWRWIISIIGLTLVGTTASAQMIPDGWPYPLRPAKYKVELQPSRMVPMRDGVWLSTDLYRPIGSEGRLPTILIRTPYNKRTFRDSRSVAFYFASQGYAVAVQDHRGKFESEGTFFPYTALDRTDGYDTLTWIAAQPWSTGKIGTYGCSYLGEVQDELAAMRHPNHTAAIPLSGSAYGGGGIIDYGFLRYGALELAAALTWSRERGSSVQYGPPPNMDRAAWFQSPEADLYSPAPTPPPTNYMEALKTLPVIDAMKKTEAPPNFFEQWLRHDPSDSWWKRQAPITDRDRFDVPALHINSWYDLTPNSTLALFNLFRINATSARGRDNQFIVMAPTAHCEFERTVASEHTMVGSRDVGDARFDYFELYLRWFDYWLKGIENGVTRMPKAQLYVMGRSKWRSEEAWPIARATYTKYFLHSDGNANSRFGSGKLSTEKSGDEAADTYNYDPRTPVPTQGGPICCTGGVVPEGGYDQSEVEMRHDVLVYTSGPLETGLEVTGPIKAVLYVSSSARDTDFTGTLVDVYPDGKAYLLQTGVLRARYREGIDHTVWIEPGKVYEITLDMEATSNYFAAGHRIRLDISSSSFPRWDRNLNTGGRNYDESTGVIAINTVAHSSRYPSYLFLPELPEEKTASK